MEQNNQIVDKNYNKPKYFIIAAIVAFVIMAAVSIYRIVDYYEFIKKDYMQLFTVFSDGFFTAGVFVGGVGALVLISGDGLFDILTYGVGLAAKYVFTTKDKRYKESYRDYKLRKQGEREGVTISFIAIVGGIYLLIGLLLAIPMMF